MQQLTKEQSGSSQLPSAGILKKTNDINRDLLIEPEFWFTHTQPHHQLINIDRTDVHISLLLRNTCSKFAIQKI
jgi:hypothetical protein